MRTIEQLRKDFDLYTTEIERCENSKCYWALLHILLALPDACATLQTDSANRKQDVGDRYVDWCTAYMPKSATVSGDDRWQMRNALLHSGSTSAQNLGTRHNTGYTHFSYVDPESFDVSFHDTTNDSHTVLNVHIAALAAETKQALESWFKALQGDSIKMSRVEQNMGWLTRRQPKAICVIKSNGTQIERTGWT